MGKNHVRVLSEIADLAGVCDSNKEVGQRVADKFKTHYFQRIDDLLSSGVDAVSIVTPTETHFENAQETLKAGVHTLLEKPATGSVEKLLELSKLAESKNLTFAIGLIERHNPIVDFASQNLKKGGFGSLISLHARRVSSYPSRIRDVGVILDLGIHDIDIIRFLVGLPATRVFAASGKFKHPDFEDHATISIEFENGVTGVVEINWLTPMKVRRLAMTCSDRYVELDYIAQSAEISSSTVREIDPDNLFHIGLEFHGRKIHLKKEEPLRMELIDFLEACEQGTKPLVTGFDAAETLRLAHMATLSAREKRTVEL